MLKIIKMENEKLKPSLKDFELRSNSYQQIPKHFPLKFLGKNFDNNFLLQNPLYSGTKVVARRLPLQRNYCYYVNI